MVDLVQLVARQMADDLAVFAQRRWANRDTKVPAFYKTKPTSKHRKNGVCRPWSVHCLIES
jgi:hypothetical protein